MNAPTEIRHAPIPTGPSPDEHASAGKALAILLYNVGARTETETKAAFTAHAEWRSA